MEPEFAATHTYRKLPESEPTFSSIRAAETKRLLAMFGSHKGTPISYVLAGKMLYPNDPEGLWNIFNESGMTLWREMSEVDRQWEARLSFSGIVVAANKKLGFTRDDIYPPTFESIVANLGDLTTPTLVNLRQDFEAPVAEEVEASIMAGAAGQ